MVVCATALMASAACARADALINANVISASGVTPYSVSLAQLTADPADCPQYDAGATWAELGFSGPEHPQLPGQNWTLETALTCLQGSLVDAAAITGITVYQADGVPEDGPDSQLQPADLSVQTDNFMDTSEVPTVGYSQPNVWYERPMRNAGDLDYEDEVVNPGPLDVDVYEIPPLQVTITPSATSLTQGVPISFTATVIDPSAPGQTPSGLQYEWNFEDGLDPSTQSNPSVTYPDAGTYTVDLHVTDAAGDAGGATTNVMIASSEPTTLTQTTTTTAPTGPTHSAGTTNGGGAGKPTKSQGSGNSGATKGAGHHRASHRPKPKSAPSAKALKHSTSSTSSKQASSAIPSAHTTTTTTGLQAQGTDTRAITSTTPSPPAAKVNPPHPSTSTTRKPTDRTSPPPRDGTRISGRLIGTVTPVTPAALAQIEAAASGSRATAPSSRPAQSASALGAIAALTGVILLLVLGAGRELGRRTRPI